MDYGPSSSTSFIGLPPPHVKANRRGLSDVLNE